MWSWALSALAVAIAIRLAFSEQPAVLQELLQHVIAQNSTFEAFLKNGNFMLNYIAIVTKGELSLRLMSVLATACSYGTLWTKWPNLNWIQIALQSGLLLRALRITWKVIEKHRYKLSPRELVVYQEHIESYGLSQREFHALLKAGAEWKSSSEDDEVIQQEGSLVHRFALLHKGNCNVFSGDTLISTLGPGDLVGEAAFARFAGSAEVTKSKRSSWAKLGRLMQGSSSATVIAVGRVEYITWPMRQLEDTLEKSSSVKACIMTMIAAALATKLRKATKRIEGIDLVREKASSVHSSTSSLACLADL